jgi:radical SAM superfamily enzyme YgiQ (UPF0313 family)
MTYRQHIEERLARETGTLVGHGRRAVALVYPSPYMVGMSSLGFQQVYRLLNGLPDTVAERAFRPDDDDPASGPVLAYESRRPVSDFPVLAFSVAYETELLGVFEVLSRCGIPLHAHERDERHPFVVAGGPLTFSNPMPLGAFVDAVVLGEAEELLAPLCDVLFAGGSRAWALRELASMPGIWVPAQHGGVLPDPARAADELLPARSAIRTPDTTLSSMALVEVERGCSRGCTFCVMRRSTNGGMRLVPPARVLESVPVEARRVGLVGAAVSDHPRIADIVRALVDRGCEVGLSSLRADRLTSTLMELLIRGGARNLTVAADGASERLRTAMQKKIQVRHLVAAAELAREHGLGQLKCYAIVGVPDETEDDIDELVALGRSLALAAGSRTRVVLGVSTFVPKHRTPLIDAPFAGIATANARLERLRRGLGREVELRAESARWAWVEYVLAQGGVEAGERALEAWQAGGGFAAFKRAFAPFEAERAARLARAG